MLNHALKAKLNSHYALVLCRAVSAGGEKFCLYLQAKKDDVLRLMAAYETSQAINFQDYGKIVWRGKGENPPDNLRDILLANVES